MAAALRRLSSRGAQSLFFFSERPAVLCRSFHTSVWWDLNVCKIPKGCDPSTVTGNIISALLKMNELLVGNGFLQQGRGWIGFPMCFSAYADMDRTNPKVKQGLSRGGVKLTHVPYSRDRHVVGTKILRDVVKWIKAHPPPGNCLFILDDVEFFPTFDRLQEEGYEILLARPRYPYCPLNDESAAKASWPSSSDVLAGRLPLWVKPGVLNDVKGRPYTFLCPSLINDFERLC